MPGETTAAAPAASTTSTAPVSTTNAEGGSEAADLGLDENGQPKKAAAPPAPPPKRREKIKTKVDGQDIEEEVDFDDLVASHQKARAFDKRMREVAEGRKKNEESQAQLNELVNLLKTSPAQVLARLGVDPLAVIERDLESMIKQQQLTPEQRQMMMREQALAQREAAIKKQEAERQRAQEEAEVNEHKNKLGALFTKTLQDEQLPSHPAVLGLMAQLYAANSEAGLDATPQELAKIVKRDLGTFASTAFKQMSGETLLGFDPELTQKFHTALLEKYQKGRQVQTPPAPEPTQRPTPGLKPGQRKMVSEKEMNEILGIR